MHQIQALFHRGQLLFAQGDFKSAHDHFAQCVQLMPKLSEAWENMAVCLVNQGVEPQTVEDRLIAQAPVSTHANIRNKMGTLRPSTTHHLAYQTLVHRLELPEAVAAFDDAWQRGTVTESDAVNFLRALFIAHEHLAKKQGQMQLPKLLNQWKDSPAIQYCMNATSQRMNPLIQQNPSTLSPEQTELVETLGLVHYTYTNYAEAAMCFQILLGRTTDISKQLEYQSHLSTCLSLNAQYKKHCPWTRRISQHGNVMTPPTQKRFEHSHCD